jgi:hypothetical protein
MTIVHYTDGQPSRNAYPREIISPTRSSDCCFTAMQDVGAVEQEGHWRYRYRRCDTCGFTVRLGTQYIPDEARLRILRHTLLSARLPDGTASD